MKTNYLFNFNFIYILKKINLEVQDRKNKCEPLAIVIIFKSQFGGVWVKKVETLNNEKQSHRDRKQHGEDQRTMGWGDRGG